MRKSGRRIVGFDLNEVAPGPDGDEWDGNVGVRFVKTKIRSEGRIGFPAGDFFDTNDDGVVSLAEVQAACANVQPGQVAPGRWEIFTHGGRKATGLDAVQWAKRMASLGAGEILLTSMDRDGTKSGFDLPLTRAVADAVNVPIIASGGITNLDDIKALLAQANAGAGICGAITGRAIYEGTLDLAAAQAAQVPVRRDPGGR